MFCLYNVYTYGHTYKKYMIYTCIQKVRGLREKRREIHAVD